MNEISRIPAPGAATDPAGPTGQLAHWLAGLRLEDVPASVRERAAYLLLDGLGCALVGARLPWSRVAADAVLGFEGAGDAPLIGWGRTIGRPAAALLNGTFIQAFELDDVHVGGPLHSASVVLPALLATAAGAPVTGRDFLRAAIAGFEVGPRVGMALHGAQMLSRGWHSGSVFGTHAAAAATGVLLRLDPARMEDALGLAGTQSGGLMAAQFEAMSKRMHHGFASRAGYTAAMLAQAGYTGIKRVFERPYGGFLAMFGEGHDPDASQVADELGQRWETDRIVVKIHAVMGGIQSTVDAVAAVRRERPFRAEDVQSLDIGVGHAVFHHGGFAVERPLTPIGAQMSLIYGAAAACLDGAAGVAQYTPGRIDADDIWALIPRIRTHEDADFNAAPDGRASARLRFTFTDGTTRDVTQRLRMSPDISNADVATKFAAMTDGVIAPDRRDRIVEAVRGIERARSLEVLLDLLGPAVASPI